MQLRIRERLASATRRLALLNLRASLALLDWKLQKTPAMPTAPGAASTGYAPGASATASTAAIPIVFIHQGNSPYLAHSLAQALDSNPQSRTILLGDDANRGHAGVEHHALRDYFSGAAEFAAVYTHYSTHPVGFELICFQRWFALNEFLKVQGLHQCVYLDSDVLLYADVTRDIAKFRRFDFTMCSQMAGCVLFVNGREGLSTFCRFVMDLYTRREPYLYDRMVAHYAVRQRHNLPGGVCDMTALQLYSEVHFGSVGEASHIIDGSVYDPNVTAPHPGFEMENGVKKVTWLDGKPWGTYVPTGELIQFGALHFTGQAKALMPNYRTPGSDCTSDIRPSVPREPASR